MAYTDSQTGTTTLVGVFDDYSSAQRASQQLMENGISRESIQIQSNFRTGAAGSTTDSTAQQEGGFMGWWHRLVGTDDEDSSSYGGHYAEAVRRGSAVLTVMAPAAMAESATEIMNSAGATDVEDRVAGWRQNGYTGYDPSIQPYSSEDAGRERDRFRAGGEESATIPVIEEELQVGKRAVRRGGVRVYSQIVETPVNEQVSLREERARVERRPVDRAVTEADMKNLRDQSIEVTEMSEEAVIGKRARVREEVIVGKESTERTQQVNETVRHTEVHVDRTGGETVNDAAYKYGLRYAADPSYQNRTWDDAETELRADYTRSNPGSAWDKVKASVRRGWEETTGRR